MIRPLALATLLVTAPAAAAEAAAGDAPPPRAPELEVSYAHDHLGRGYRDWRALAAEVAFAPAERTELRAGARGTERFGLRDLELSAGFSSRRIARWSLAAEGSFSPTHRVLPNVTLGGHVARELGHGLVAGAGLRWIEYATTVGRSDGGVGDAGLEWYAGAWRLAGTGYLATLDGAWEGAARAAVDRFYGDEGRAGLALAAGHDLENTGARILRTPVRFAGLSGRHPLGAAWSIVWELSAQQQGHYYTRVGGRLGVRRRL